MTPFTPHILVSLLALGMGLAFLSADRHSGTSKALAVMLGAMGVAIVLNVVLIDGGLLSPAASGWLALPESLSIVAALEWLLRVRRMVPAAPGMDVRAGDRALRAGQLSAVVYSVISLAAPEARVEHFLHRMISPESLHEPVFWLFATPILFSEFTGLVAIALLLNRRPDRAETARVLAMAGACPFFVMGFVLPLEWGPLAVVLGEIVLLVGAVRYHVVQGQRGQFMSRFLSPQVARLVNERGLRSAMQENFLEITVVCCDLRGFTAYAEAHPSSRVIQVLREYYDAVGEVVAEFGATIKDFAGDGVLILVGAPLPVTDHADRGIAIARRIQQVCATLTGRWSSEQQKLGLGLGVATGAVTVGVIGSASRLEYTAVGSAVNLACRLCEQALDCEILVDDRTAALIDRSGLHPRAALPIKGYAALVPHYGLNPAP